MGDDLRKGEGLALARPLVAKNANGLRCPGALGPWQRSGRGNPYSAASTRVERSPQIVSATENFAGSCAVYIRAVQASTKSDAKAWPSRRGSLAVQVLRSPSPT